MVFLLWLICCPWPHVLLAVAGLLVLLACALGGLLLVLATWCGKVGTFAGVYAPAGLSMMLACCCG